MFARTQELRRAADCKLGRVAGDIDKGLVDLLDHLVGIGHHQADGRLEGDGRNAHLVLHVLAFADVGIHAANGIDVPALVANRHLDRGIGVQAAVGVRHHLFDLAASTAGQHPLVVLLVAFGQLRREYVKTCFPQHFGPGQAVHRLKLAVDVQKVTLQILHENHGAGVLGNGPQLGLALFQLQPGVHPVDDVAQGANDAQGPAVGVALGHHAAAEHPEVGAVLAADAVLHFEALAVALQAFGQRGQNPLQVLWMDAAAPLLVVAGNILRRIAEQALPQGRIVHFPAVHAPVPNPFAGGFGDQLQAQCTVGAYGEVRVSAVVGTGTGVRPLALRGVHGLHRAKSLGHTIHLQDAGKQFHRQGLAATV